VQTLRCREVWVLVGPSLRGVSVGEVNRLSRCVGVINGGNKKEAQAAVRVLMFYEESAENRTASGEQTEGARRYFGQDQSKK